jgi:hypothetical protein
MPKPQIEKLLTGLAGEFLVAGQLCLKGYVASLTLKNYPGVDIFCLNPKTGKQVAIQVKTKRGGRHYYVPENVDQFKSPFVIVYINSEIVDFYVVPATQVTRLSAKQRDAYLRGHPNVKQEQPRMLDIKTLGSFKERWDLLGLG